MGVIDLRNHIVFFSWRQLPEGWTECSGALDSGELGVKILNHCIGNALSTAAEEMSPIALDAVGKRYLHERRSCKTLNYRPSQQGIRGNSPAVKKRESGFLDALRDEIDSPGKIHQLAAGDAVVPGLARAPDAMIHLSRHIFMKPTVDDDTGDMPPH